MTNVPERDFPRNDYSVDSERAMSRSGNTTLWIVVAVAIVLVLSVGWYGYGRNTSVPALTNDTTPPLTAPAPAPSPAPAQPMQAPK